MPEFRDWAFLTKVQRKELSQVAQGKIPADLVIQGGKLIDVFGGIIRQADIAIKGERIACVGRIDHTIGDMTKRFDATGYYLSPGLIDLHVHIEASMLTPTHYAEAVIPSGTTAVLWETLWSGNVLGIQGIKLLLEEANQTLLKVFLAAASGVPSISPRLATPANVFGPSELQELLGMDQVLSLGEVIYLNELLNGDTSIHTLISEALGAKKRVDGSAASYDEIPLSAFAAAGVTNDHEAVTVDEAESRIFNGQWLVIREGSGFSNLKETIKAISERKLSPRRVCFCTDDKDVRDILETGVIDHCVRQAINVGIDPVTAVQMATLNAAEYLQVDTEIGGIGPGRIADIVLVQDLEDFRARVVFVNGLIAARDGNMQKESISPHYPPQISSTVKINRKFLKSDFIVSTLTHGPATVRVIRVLSDPSFTLEDQETLQVVDGEIPLPIDVGKDLLKLAMIERHGKTPGPNIATGFVRGFEICEGTIGTTIAPDIHQIIVIGSSDEDMAHVANRLVEIQGGIVVCNQGIILAEMSLPIGGIISTLSKQEASEQLGLITHAINSLGCPLEAPLMILAFVGGVGGMPFLKISDKGLVDTMGGNIVPLEIDQ